MAPCGCFLFVLKKTPRVAGRACLSSEDLLNLSDELYLLLKQCDIFLARLGITEKPVGEAHDAHVGAELFARHVEAG